MFALAVDQMVDYHLRSLQAHYDELCINIAVLNKNKNIGIIVLSETWNISNIDSYEINGFLIYYNEAKYNKCDGAMAFVGSSKYPLDFQLVDTTVEELYDEIEMIDKVPSDQESIISE
ncbi:unnamed protein product [Acanthoscelides obtectus]|uniref:Uncharacterized protein n=1 Tax=Acanthoscelides obtectus TaxID=200917 RepID=A0A9P0K3D2_ACAOB|nr:unnamed protein product [Acanthoscelides obtectus]CAK1639008.1 hypothetical protein AOBTE_LOCUS10944 [Acanthoscelides obtectus]